MAIVNVELEFKPEMHAVCYLLDAPVVLPIALLSYFLGNVCKVLPSLMLVVTLSFMIFLLLRFVKYSRACAETEVTVYPDRIEAEVGMKNPKLTMIEFVNFKEVKPVQSFVQKIFKTYSIQFTYKSDFEDADIIYKIRDFKDPKPICDKINAAVSHAGLIAKMT